MTRKAWIIFVAACIALFGVILLVNKKPSIDISGVDASKVITSKYADHVYGNKNAKVVLVEYGDYECSHCGAAYPQIKAVAAQYKEQVAFVFRNYPLTALHPNALAGATAAEAAALQGKFWEMHDMLYENQSSWSSASTSQRDDYFAEYAKQLGLDVNKFKADELDSSVADKISFDQTLGSHQGVSGTPALFIGGTQVSQDTATDIQNGTGSKLADELNAALTKAGLKAITFIPAASQVSQ